ncbi:YceD family protein [Bacillus horti]|uniref:DUF177 domain-containing protein n=1 Tax=Caldalkalibacillus horti TaxID=77523 RepID=A0ABT9VVC4_9BACI|nr:YceD family protein [Bacillus horti]MDQ0164580.1 uncharacterized protein [Bacillus horti]
MKIEKKSCFELKGKQMTLEHTYELPHLVEQNKQLLALSPAKFSGKGEMEAGLFIVKGVIVGQYTLPCSRCLTDVIYDYEQDIEELFSLQPSILQIETEEDEDDLTEEIHPVHGQEIDLTPYIEEEILMSIPFVPTCQSKEECEANQVLEGTGWSVLTEEMKKNKIDPRLADLAKLFDQKKD